MSNWKDFQVAQERRNDIIRSVERQQLIAATRRNNADSVKMARRGRITHIYGPIMASVGGIMVKWGMSLRARYAEFSSELGKFSAKEAVFFAPDGENSHKTTWRVKQESAEIAAELENALRNAKRA